MNFGLFKRYRAGRDPVSANDLNARADVLEALNRIKVSPPLTMQRDGTGLRLGVRAASRSSRVFLARIRAAIIAGEVFTNGRAIAQSGDVRYLVEPVDPDAPEWDPDRVWIPTYGRPVYEPVPGGDSIANDQAIHTASAGDLCFIIDEPGHVRGADDPPASGRAPGLVLHILSEQIAFEACTVATNVPGTEPPPLPLFAPNAPNSPPGGGMVYRNSATFEADISIAHYVSPPFDVRNLESVFLIGISKETGANWNSGVVQLQYSRDERFWIDDSMQLAADGESTEIDAKKKGWVRFRVSVAASGTTRVDFTWAGVNTTGGSGAFKP